MKDDKVKDVVGGVKTYFVEMPKKRRNMVLTILGVVVAVAIALTVFLNYNASQYRVLYGGIDQAEKATVFQLLQEQGVAVAMNAQGEITVPANQYDELLLSLAGQGYPQSALSYDIFSNYTGLTATESERKTGLLYQLQNRLQQTLERIEGVQGATVTINIPDNSDNVWQQTESKELSQASVLLKLGGKSLSAAQVDAVRKLVASSCPNMKPEQVTVVDAASSLELYGSGATSDGSTLGFSSSQNLELETMAQQKLEDAVKRLLAPRYGEGGVVAAAKVTLNYDKMITEQNQIQGDPNPSHTEGEYTLDGEQTYQGIVGETNNTDTPGYGYEDAANKEGMTHFRYSTDNAYSYIKTQIEKNTAELERATISVMIQEQNLTQALRTELVGLISTGVDIPAAQISVSSFNAPTVDVPQEPELIPATGLFALIEMMPWWGWFAAGAALIMLIAGLCIAFLMREKKKARQRAQQKQLEEEALRKVNNEIAEYKKQLSDAAKEGVTDVDEAIMNEVKDFAKVNPEVTANLLRSWLRDGN